MSNGYRDPDLDDVLQDDELRRIASLLSTVRQPEPPLDDAFRSGLRRQLMNEAWGVSERGESWWRRLFRPPGLAWAGAAAGLVLIAGAVTYYVMQPAGGLQQVFVYSPLDGSNQVALQQPILVNFNQAMDHQSTQDAVTITPATNVTYSWQSNTLAVTPSSGTLAPNTQYQVTVGPGARTAAGQPLSTAQTITFVTQPPVPTPTPTPRPTPAQGLGEKQLAPLGGLTTAPLQWSADSSTIYFVDASGALRVVPAKGGDVTVVAPGGVTSPSISPAGDRLAYIRGGKIEVLTFATGHTDELTPPSPPTLVGWAKDQLVWATASAVFTQGTGTGAPAQLAPLPSTGTVSVTSIAPAGAHAVYQQDQSLILLDLSTGKSVALGQAGATFLSWSPDGTQVLYSSGGADLVSDLQGNTTATLAQGDASWSTQDAILLGGETSLYQVRPDGSNHTRLANGTYRAPVWAPNGTTFAFFRGGALWTATAPPLPPEPTALDQATAAARSFMDARLNKQPDQAAQYLDANGKQAYASGGLALIVDGDPSFSRYYILSQEITGSNPDTARLVVRLVLTHGKLDVSDLEETLTLVRDAGTKQFLVDQATGGSRRDLGKGPEVVGVDVSNDMMRITFDSDLDAGTIPGGVVLLDPNGQPVTITPTYSGKTVTFSGLDLKPGAKFRLQVTTSLRDVLGRNVASEYDLDVPGPVPVNHTSHKTAGDLPSPSPESSPTPAG
ncbi:MAG TPA: Ig-like domain-containing protein [Candidatus Dormibacteraeota bacterium]|nr:Ig-like domain-containing protein [Candidatus Dormibacteraeota bacterium]